MNNLTGSSPSEFIQFLKSKNIQRCFIAYDKKSGKPKASHSEIQPLADFFAQDTRDYMKHEGVFLQLSKNFDSILCAFVHSSTRGQAAGGTRFWQYENMESVLRDGLRLSKGMTRKNALAGLWWGGGKGIIVRDPKMDTKDPKAREKLFKEYGDFVTSLNGCYITAEDVGTNTTDVGNIFSRCRFVISVPEECGGSGNPSIATARGVVRGMEAAIHFVEGSRSSLEGKKIVVQGMGNVAEPMMEFLFEKHVGEIVACDINPETVDRVKKKFTGKPLKASVIDKGDMSILFEPCDILAPCATGAIINPKTIPQIRAKILCGAANNQLEDGEREDKMLLEKGILYVPDFLVNRMGIVNCCNEQYGYIDHDPLIEQHLNYDWDQSVYQTTLRVLRKARSTGIGPGHMAVELADEMAQKAHPMFGHRGQLIIDSLVRNHWERG